MLQIAYENQCFLGLIGVGSNNAEARMAGTLRGVEADNGAGCAGADVTGPRVYPRHRQI